MMTAITRRHVLAGAAATVAAAALPAVAEAVPLPRGVVLAGNRKLVDPATAQVGDWYWDYDSRDVVQLTEQGWKFLFNLADGARIPSDAEIADLVPRIEAAEIRRSYTMAEIEAEPRWEFS